MDDLNFLNAGLSAKQPNPVITDRALNEIKEKPYIVVVEDDNTLGQAIQMYLSRTLGLEVLYFSSGHDCIQGLDNVDKNTGFCLVSDISLGQAGLDGLGVVDLLAKRGLKFASIVITGFASIETAIAATKKGVYHYLTKPFELSKLHELVSRALGDELGFESKLNNQQEVPSKNSSVNSNLLEYKIEEPTKDDIFCGMVGRSKVMKDVFARIEKVALTDSTVLINGPSGAGKELVANAIHKLSERCNSSKVTVNCGAIPAELLESELFGHEKGAFTGAISSRKGRFEMADTGTIFLDEIGDMPLLLQVKLLRVLQNKTIEPVGADNSRDVDVRVVTATHRDLESRVADGNFREDLYYRLNVIPIRIPALSERREDVPILIGMFLKRFVSADGRNKIEFTNEAMQALVNYSWPGNVRELENLIERLVILRGGHLVNLEDLPPKFLDVDIKQKIKYENYIELPEEGIDLKQVISSIEDSLIMQAMEKTGGNKNQSSKLLKLNRTTLIEKMKKKGLEYRTATV